jgi:Protein of unknown function (DUF3311)
MTHYRPRRPRTAAWVAVTILLVVAVAGTLAVPIYARSTPALVDFPFFYWYQLLWVPVVGILAGIAYLIIRPADAEAAAAGRGDPAPPGVSPDDAEGAI